MATQPSVTKLRIANPSLEGNQITYLTQDINIGATSLSILSKAGFLKAEHNNDSYFYVLIGKYGQEKSEIVKVTSDDTANQSLTIAACKYSHSASDPVTYIPYNQVQFIGRTTSGGSSNVIATLDIDCTKQTTEYTYEGTTYGFFVVAYYNSQNDEISGYSEEITSTSFTHRSIERIIKSAARKALTKIDESESSVLNWDIALEIAQDGLDEIIARKRKWPFLHVIDSNTTTTPNVAYISKPNDLSFLDGIKYDGKKLLFVSQVRYNQYTDNTQSVTGDPICYTEKNNEYHLYPIPVSSKTITYEYYKVPSTLTSLSTEIDLPFVSCLIYYIGSQMAYIRGNDKRGDKLLTSFKMLLEQQVEEFTGPLQLSDAEQVEQTSGIYQDFTELTY